MHTHKFYFILIFYSSELEESDCRSEVYEKTEFVENPFPWEFELPPSILLSTNCGSSDRGWSFTQFFSICVFSCI